MIAIVAGAVALTALAVLYLLRLRRRPLWVSSTLHWIASSRDLEVNVPIRMLRPSWLLLLHALAIALIAFALGRPALDLSSANASRIVLVIDRSASMNARDAIPASRVPRTRLDQARSEARAIVRAAGRSSGASVALVTFSSEASIHGGLTADRSLVERSIESIHSSDESASGLARAMDLVEAILAADAEEAASPARVIIITDGDLPEYARSVAGAIVEFIRVGPAPGLTPDTRQSHDNLGIVALAARRLEGEGRVRLFARIQNASSQERNVIAVALADGIEFARRPLKAPANGDTSFTLDVQNPQSALLTVRLDTTDLLDADDEASILVAPARPTRVLVVTPTGDPDRDGTWPVIDVLRELPRVTVRALSEEAWRSMAGLPVDTDLFTDLIVLCGVDAGWLRDRGFPAPVLSFGPRSSVESAAPPVPPELAGSVVAWERAHPLMRHLSLDGVAIGLSRTFSAAAGDPRSGSAPIVWSDTGPVVIAGERDRTRFVSLGFEVSETTWPLTFAWPLFIENAVGWLTRSEEESAGRVWRAGEPIAIPAPRGPSPVALLDPSGRPRGEFIPVMGLLRIGVLDRVGTYLIPSGADSQISVPVALLDPRESALRTSDRLSIGAATVMASDAADLPREIWHWFVLAAAVLLALEWLVFAHRARV